MVQLQNRKAELSSELDALAKEIEELNTTLLEDFAKDGLSSVKTDVDGSKVTLYLRRDVYAKVLDPLRLNDVLRSEGLGDLVKETVNAQTLRAKIREWEDEGGIPASFDTVLTSSEVYSVRVRKA
jgi:prefoldin subunit 5